MLSYINEHINLSTNSLQSIPPYTDIRFISSSFVALLLAACSYYYLFKYQFWSRIGLKTPFPLPFIGTAYNLLTDNRVHMELANVKKYGKLHGLYFGSKPRLAVADPDVLRQICIKDFHIFPNHHLDNLTNEYQEAFIFFLRDTHWKKVRSIISPTFTSGKIKRMTKLMNYCIDDLALIFDESARKKRPINCKDAFGLYTMDVVASCLYAIKLQRATSDGNLMNLSSLAKSMNGDGNSSREAFVRDALAFTDPQLSRILALVLVPKFILRLVGFSAPAKTVFENLANKSKALIGVRRRSGKKVDDFLQLLIDARLDDKLELTDMDEMENHHIGLTKNSMLIEHNEMSKEVNRELQSNKSTLANGQSMALTDVEVLANAMFLLMVGYDTTASLLSHCAYALAFHKDIQAKLYDELKGIVNPIGKSFDYDKLTSAVYLDSVISETLRLLSPVVFLDRECNEDYYIEKYNITIPKGTVVNLSYFAIHNDPDYWPNPEKFDPSRFFPENRDKIYPGSYTPFGHGPRHCIGARFSLTEAKLAIARLLIDYEFSPAPKTSFPPKPAFTLALMRYSDVNVLVSKRSSE